MIKVESLLKSRRFWMAVAGLVVAVGNDGVGLNLTEDQVTFVVTMLASWIVGDSVRKTE